MIKSGKQHILLIAILLIISGGGVFYTINNLKFEESFSSILPSNDENRLLLHLLDSASVFDRVIVHIHTPDSAEANPKLLVKVANKLIDSTKKKFVPEFIEKIEGKTSPDIQNTIYSNFVEFLPQYLTKSDYQRIDSIINSGSLDALVQEHIKILNSPAGYMAAKYIFRDPFGIVSPQLERLEDLQVDDNLVIYKNFLVSKDKRHLTFFLVPVDASNTRTNKIFVEQYNQLISELAGEFNNAVTIEYLGSLPIATANADRIRKDIQLTINIAILVIVILIFYFYRKWQYLALILLPAFIGAITSLAYFTFAYGKISAISLGIGSVLLGISVDYALHILTHLKHTKDIRSVIKDVALPVLMSSVTTASAFLGLLSLSSPAIRQLGIFAAISVFIAALVSVIVLPKLINIRPKKSGTSDTLRITFIEKLAGYQHPKKKWGFVAVVIITIGLIPFISKVAFEENFENMNYMPDELKKAEFNLDKAGDFSGKKSYLLSAGNNLDEAIKNSGRAVEVLDSLKQAGLIERYNSINNLLNHSNDIYNKNNIWNYFWSKIKITNTKELLYESAKKYHIKPEAYQEFYSIIGRKYSPHPSSVVLQSFDEVAGSFVIKTNSKIYIAHIIHLPDENRNFVAQLFSKEQGNHIIDKKVFYTGIFNNLQIDFRKLLYISLTIVFLIILFFLGRIELATITFLPILISWTWTIGIIGILGIKLNFFNIVICSLIFGLGIDYSIFITKGLMQEYKTGRKRLQSYKSSILISAITTLIGLGVLLLAKHPALKSIAGLAIIGISSSVLISFIFQPALFRFLTGPKEKKRVLPISLDNLVYTSLTFGLWGAGAIVLTVALPLILLLPLKAKTKRRAIRYASSKVCGWIIYYHPRSKFRKINFDKLDLSKSSIIISNHQSMVDILFYLSISPNIIILTKDWVWNNPIFGAVVRFSGHINVSLGYDQLEEIINQRIEEGCSLVVFPEGSRTKNGAIKRFHKGGFYLAEQHSLPIHKIVIHGLFEMLPPGAPTLGQGVITAKYISSYKFDDPGKNIYSRISKESCAEMRKVYAEIQQDKAVLRNHNYRIGRNFIYKGPILEHYVKVKMRLEKNYQVFNRLVPTDGKIYDLGCGYGTMPMMLCMLEPGRTITAIDYDGEKIETARNTQLNGELGIDFIAGDALELKMEGADCIIISDMLHYLKPEEQERLLANSASGLSSGGKIVIRDADSSKTKRHKGTKFSEFLSTNIGFNKVRNNLNFFASTLIEDFAANNNLNLEIIDKTKYNSNLIYVLSRRK